MAKAKSAEMKIRKKRWIDIVDSKISERFFPFDFPDEMCLSLPGKAYLTQRFRQIVVEDMDGKRTSWYYGDEDGEEADVNVIAIQQEIDHLNGILLEDIAVSSRDVVINKPIVNEHRDVGRNDPCPCGSGLKYKKCCLT